jgi:serine/threonine protein kinase
MIDKELDDDKLQLRHFRFIKELGEGSFGQVFLARCSKNNQMYALKVFKKKKLVMNKQIKFAIS